MTVNPPTTRERAATMARRGCRVKLAFWRLPSKADAGARTTPRRPTVTSADVGEQPQRLGQSRVDGGRKQEEGQEGGGHSWRVAGIPVRATQRPTGTSSSGVRERVAPGRPERRHRNPAKHHDHAVIAAPLIDPVHHPDILEEWKLGRQVKVPRRDGR
jgi:hypothetical protein